MGNENLQRLLAIIAGLAEAYSRDLSKTAIKLMVTALDDLDVESLSRAATEHMRDPIAGKFFPRPADLIARVRGIADDSASRAWSRYLRTVNQQRHTGCIAFDDAALHATIDDLGGPSVIARAGEFELAKIRKDFDALYIGHLARTVRPGDYKAVLVLSTAGRNEPPVLIGDETRALAVIANGQGADRYPQLGVAVIPQLERA